MTLKILWDSQRFSFISLWILVEFDIFNQVEILKDSLKILSKESLSQTALKDIDYFKKNILLKKKEKESSLTQSVCYKSRARQPPPPPYYIYLFS